jgi:iduronate 2-sulfatase
MKRAAVFTFITLFGLLLVRRNASPASEIPKTPAELNVLFIAVDDLRTSLGCYGDTLVKSPNIDRLARRSRLFTRAYCHQAVCGPSRTSILTGRLPDNTRVWHNRNLFRDTLPDAITLPEYFKSHGYHAQSLGKVFSGNASEAEQNPGSWSVPPLLKGPGWSNYALEESRRGNSTITAPAAARSARGLFWLNEKTSPMTPPTTKRAIDSAP